MKEFSDDPKQLAAGGKATLDRLDTAKAGFEAELATVPSALAPSLVVMAKTMKQLRDAIAAKAKVNLDLKAFRAAAQAVADGCRT